MLIKSNYKDYYDYVAHVYGGGDPVVKYIREKFPVPEDKISKGYIPTSFEVEVTSEITQLPGRYYYRDDPYSYKWLIIAGKYYLLRSKQVAYELAEPYQLYHSDDPKLMALYIGADGGKPLIELSRQLKAPVFMISDTRSYYGRQQSFHAQIEYNIPVLKDYGIPSIIPAEQMYQDISYFIGNVMHESPDTAPPVTISDKDRIVQHGFDLKKSFRHRVG